MDLGHVPSPLWGLVSSLQNQKSGWIRDGKYVKLAPPLPSLADISNDPRLSLLSPGLVSESFSTQHFRQLALELKRVATPGLEQSPGSLPGHALELCES